MNNQSLASENVVVQSPPLGASSGTFLDVCANCATPIQQPLGRGRPRKHCSQQCRDALIYRQKTAAKVHRCGQCRSVFEPTSKNQKYCSQRCLLYGVGKKCPICAAYFIASQKRSKFCSNQCVGVSLSLRARARHKANRAKWRHARRARLKSVPSEVFQPLTVYQQAHWLCGICGDKVDQQLLYPDPLSASLDHIIPIALGGSHTSDNVQLAHLICNVLKGKQLARA